MCVFVHLQERERGEANGLTDATQRQLPRKRRAQGKSGNKLVSGAFCTSGKSLRFHQTGAERVVFSGCLSRICQGVMSQQQHTKHCEKGEGS